MAVHRSVLVFLLMLICAFTTIVYAREPGIQVGGQVLGPVQSYSYGNSLAVQNGAVQPSRITIQAPVFLRTIRTYHWNDGRGTPPGIIGLFDADGRVYGPWRARGLPGQGGVPNAYWEAQVDARIEPGIYTISTSSNDTWSTNAEAKGRGFYEVTWQEIQATPPSQGVGAQSLGAPVTGPGRAAPVPPSPAPTGVVDPPSGLIFSGRPSEAWSELSVAGGNFRSFSRFEDQALIVDVPAGNGWGKTGIWSRLPLVPAPAKRASNLDFSFDSGRTSSFVVALGSGNEPDEWTGHTIRVAWSRSDDGTSAQMKLWVRQTEVMAASLPPKAPSRVLVQISSKGDVLILVPDAAVQLEGHLPDEALTLPMRVYALAHAPAQQKPAQMALRSISLHEIEGEDPYLPQNPADLFFDRVKRMHLFAGNLGREWVPHSAHGGRFALHALLGNGRLDVNVPPGHDWAKVGIRSRGALLWLDHFGDGAEARLRFSFDPAGTTGFGLAISLPVTNEGEDPAHPSVRFYWLKGAGDIKSSYELHVDPHRQNDFWKADAPDTSPGEVVFILRPGMIAIEIDGVEKHQLPWNVPAEGVGLRIFAFSHPLKANQPVKMALRRIDLDRVYAAQPDEVPAPGVEPLPSTLLFDGSIGSTWLASEAAGGNFSRFARPGTGELVVEVPNGHGWGKTGLLSAEPVLMLDDRVSRTPTRFSIQVDPQATTGMRIAFNTKKDADMWSGHDPWITFAKEPHGRSYLIECCQYPSLVWSRRVPAKWIESDWNGILSVHFGDDWTSVCLDKGPCIRGNSASRALRYMTILAHAWAQNGSTRMTLRRVSRSLVTPTGMTALERFALIDDDNFDPRAFLNALMRSARQ